MNRTDIERFQMHGQDIPGLLSHQAERKPDHPALVWAPREGAGQRWTYAELLDAVRRMASGLSGISMRRS